MTVSPKRTLKRAFSSAKLRMRNRASNSAANSDKESVKPRRKGVIEEHYLVDTIKMPKSRKERKIVLPGVPSYENDFARDTHDFFNLVALIPIIVLNGMNWNWEKLLKSVDENLQNYSIHFDLQNSWTGDWFDVFFRTTILYFIIDLIWVVVVPKCVKSSNTIVYHHIATLGYLSVPYVNPRYQWCMGACMSVEINTWFLIARRVFNKQGFPPWTIKLPPLISIRIKVISIMFYSTWFSLRCILYPLLLIFFVEDWKFLLKSTGTAFNLMTIVIPLHSIFLLLNFKWTYDLVGSKMRYWRTRKLEIASGL
mmetsp:Transcript_34462/g.41575  ORF Transcript_34462/g.41575 Transcript_34462/m.41575 type:complete len:310 (-) Transcript_34462:156-1085(-)